MRRLLSGDEARIAKNKAEWVRTQSRLRAKRIAEEAKSGKSQHYV